MNELESTLVRGLQAEAEAITRSVDTSEAARRLEARFDQIDRDRGHRIWRTALAAAAAAVLIAGGVYGVIKIEPSTRISPAKEPHTTVSPYSQFTEFGKPGTYRVRVARDAAGVAVNADLTFYVTGWGVDDYPVLTDREGNYGGVAVFRPTALAAGTGCLAGKVTSKIGRTPTQLGQQLAQLPKSTVVQPPTTVRALGQDAAHVRLRINPWCLGGVYRVAWTPRGGHGISYGDTPRQVVIDFWAMDIRGVPVVVDMWHQVGASSHLVQEIARTWASIKIATRG